MEEGIPATSAALREALDLSEELLADIELERIALASVALKASRLARLLNDFDMMQILRLEAAGYPSSGSGLDSKTWRLAGLAGRHYKEKKDKDSAAKDFAYTESIGELEGQLITARTRIAAARDPAVSISSANPHQFVKEPGGNTVERTYAESTAQRAVKRLAQRRTFLHDYVIRRNFELKFSGVANDVFARYRELVDRLIGDAVPDAVMKFNAVQEGLQSSNEENWANAVHSCRRILQDLADAVYPAREPKVQLVGGKERKIMLGADNYINRLVCFVEENIGSTTAAAVVGSNLSFLGERLDAIFSAAQKGSHSSVSREEADRSVVQTYLMVGDILRLRQAMRQPE